MNMLELHYAPSLRRYVLVNSWTGLVLNKGNGSPRTFRTQRGAIRKARKLERRLARSMYEIKRRPSNN